MLIATAQNFPSAHRLWEQVVQHYRSLESFSTVIRHESFSGKYPGVYTQLLRWRRDRFELVVTRKAKYAADASPLNRAPSFFSDGKRVVAVWPDRHTTTEPLEESSTSAWDATAGPLLAILNRNPAENDFDQAHGYEFAYGPIRRWQGHDVREIDVSNHVEGLVGSVHLMVTLDRILLGYEWEDAGKLANVTYTAQAENPPLPANLGTPRIPNPPKRGTRG